MAHALAVMFPDLKPMEEERELAAPQGGLRFCGARHQVLDPHLGDIDTRRIDGVIGTDRFGHKISIPRGGRLLIMAVD
jgi:hypothetical protein